jgi:hypothetical protein
LNFGPDGALYVAEAGRGSNGVASAPNFVSSDTMTKYYGDTGSITKIVLGRGGSQSRLVTGLPSVAPLNGVGATGPHDVDFQGLGNGFVTIGLGADPAKRIGADLEHLASLVRFRPNGKWSFEQDLGAFEALANPDAADSGDPNNPTPADSNPYGLLALPGRQIFTDAGGNTLNAVAANGAISNLAVFHKNPTAPPFQAVPTSVALGPDGALYVGQLTGGPFPAGAASVFRVPANGGAPEVPTGYGGFTKIIDIAFGPDGSLYVLQIATRPGGPPATPADKGILVRVLPDGTKQTVVGENDGLITPGGVAFGSNGSIYITNFSIQAGGAGTVVKVNP